jgi:imidazole glycerol phosphate synthase subunit HisF
VDLHCEFIGPATGVYLALLQSWGVGEIVLTHIARDGMMGGYHLDLLRTAKDSCTVPVVINGGCGKVEHMAEAFGVGADAVAASSMFLFKDVTPRKCAATLKKWGHPVRLDDMDTHRGCYGQEKQA